MEMHPLDRTEERPTGEIPEDGAVSYSLANLDVAKSRDFSANRREYRAQMRHRAAEQLRLMELKAQSEAEAAAVEAEAEAAAAHAEADAATAKLAASRTMHASGTMKVAERPEDVEADEQVEHMRRSSLREAAQQARRAAAERLEAARRAEAAALADSIARREEREIAEAQASALRQAALYAESEARARQTKAMSPDQRQPVAPSNGHLRARPAATDESLIPRSWADITASGPQSFEPPREPKPVFGEFPLPVGRETHRLDEEGEAPLRRAQKPAAEAGNGNAGPLGRVIVTSTPYQEFRRVANNAQPLSPSDAPSRSPSPLTSESGRRAAESLIGLEHANPPSTWPVRAESAKQEALRTSMPRSDSQLPVDPLAPSWLYPKAPVPQPEGFRVDHQMRSSLQASAQSMEQTIRREPLQIPFAPARMPLTLSRNGAADSTLQHAREQAASRWYALQGVTAEVDREEANSRPAVREKRLSTPFVMVYSLAGGVGKTSLVATLGRVLASLGEKVLLTDTTSQGLLPFYFGAKELHPRVVRTFSPPSGGTDTPIDLISYDLTGRNRVPNRSESEAQSEVFEDLVANSRRANRVLMDLSVNCAWLVGRLAWTRPTVLIPLAADMNSVISLRLVERTFAGMQDADGKALQPVYILNQFDGSLPLHLDVRETLRKQLGDRLLPLVVRRSDGVSEALAEGMTVIDFDPESGIAKDYIAVANWLREIAAPSAVGLSNMRWVER